MNKERILYVRILAIILALISSTALVCKVQMDAHEKFVEYCNEKYGEGNWTAVEDYNPKISLFGVVYECVLRGDKE